MKDAFIPCCTKLVELMKEIAELKANSIPKSLVMDMISKWMYEKNKTGQYQDSKHHIYATGALSALNSMVNQGE